MTESLYKYKAHYLLVIAVGLVVIFGLLGGLGDQAGALSVDESVEVGITSVSPLGLSGGLAIPASCPSDAHCALACTSCTSSANACGQTNTGTYSDSCPSVCSATTPADSLCPLPSLPDLVAGDVGDTVGTQQSWSAAGTASFTVPTDVTSIVAKVWGGGGGGGVNDIGSGSGLGGGGGYATGILSVTPGESLTIVVANGGGRGISVSNDDGGGGGGGSAVKRGLGFGFVRLIVAGGGGGGPARRGSDNGDGGPGGASVGISGSVGVSNCSKATGGTQSTAGSGSACSRINGNAGFNGTGGGGGQGDGVGGDAGSGDGRGGTGGSAATDSGGGGGGGGYFGGGGGGTGDSGGGSGGGGGSSFVPSGGSTVAGSGTSAGNNTDPDYAVSAGRGGLVGVDGNPGRVVLIWTEAESPGGQLEPWIVNPAPYTEGANLTFASFMTNIGDANAVGAFDNRFQIAVDADIEIDAEIPIVYDINDDLLSSMVDLFIGSPPKRLDSNPWNNVPAGTHAVRFCVDISGAGTSNSILESNEENNCGEPFVFTVAAAAVILPPTLIFSPDATPIPWNTATNLNWDTTGAGGGPVDICTASGDWSGSKTPVDIGSESTENLIVAQTYKLQCSGPGGLSPFRTVIVNVGAEPLAECDDGDIDNDGDGVADIDDPGCHTDGDASNPDSYDPNDNTEGDVTIDANPGLIRSGDFSTVIWSSGGDPLSCTIEGPGISSTDPDGQSNTGPLTEASTYTITCDYGDGELQAESTVVIVLPKIIEE